MKPVAHKDYSIGDRTRGQHRNQGCAETSNAPAWLRNAVHGHAWQLMTLTGSVSREEDKGE